MRCSVPKWGGKMRLTICGWLGGLAGLAIVAPAMAQAPAVPPAPATPSATTAATYAQQNQPRNIWDFLCKRPEQRAEKKERFCNSVIGQLFSNLLRPVTLY